MLSAPPPPRMRSFPPRPRMTSLPPKPQMKSLDGVPRRVSMLAVPTIVHAGATLVPDAPARAAGTATEAQANAIAQAKNAAVFGIIPAPRLSDIRGGRVPNPLRKRIPPEARTAPRPPRPNERRHDPEMAPVERVDDEAVDQEPAPGPEQGGRAD